MKVIMELRPESYPPPQYSSECACGMKGPAEECGTLTLAYHRGWWRHHVLTTGHTVTIVESTAGAR